MTRAGSFLKLSADRYPDRPCFVFGDGSEQTFAETNSRVNRLAGALATAGVTPGGRVAIVATDSGGYVEVLLACMKLGATYVPLNNRLQEDELLTLLHRAEPKALFASARYLDVCRGLAPRVASIGLLCAFDGEAFDGAPAEGVVPFEE